eukprot:scaffold68525_cov37-Attheya_sp.AAC.2
MTPGIEPGTTGANPEVNTNYIVPTKNWTWTVGRGLFGSIWKDGTGCQGKQGSRGAQSMRLILPVGTLFEWAQSMRLVPAVRTLVACFDMDGWLST